MIHHCSSHGRIRWLTELPPDIAHLHHRDVRNPLQVLPQVPGLRDLKLVGVHPVLVAGDVPQDCHGLPALRTVQHIRANRVELLVVLEVPDVRVYGLHVRVTGPLEGGVHDGEALGVDDEGVGVVALVVVGDVLHDLRRVQVQTHDADRPALVHTRPCDTNGQPLPRLVNVRQ